ncbi:MAG: FixH family protein [Woeseiaceae bacterium]
MPVAGHGHGGVVEEDDLCVINIGYLKAHFKVYTPQETQHDEYCEDIPVRGESVFVMEYQHDGLGEAEIDFRIIRNVTGKGVFARLGDVEAIDDIDAVTVRYEPPAVVPDVFTLLHAFDTDGEFIGIVSARQLDTGKIYTAVFPFEVGYTGAGYWPWIVGALLLLQLNYWVMSRRRSRSAAAMLLIACIALPNAAHTDESDEWTSDAGHFRLRFRSELEPLKINTIHSWVLFITDNDGNKVDGAAITVAGGMPEHDHGMPTAPRVTAGLGDGRYRVEGMRFHMRGDWEVRIEIDTGSERDGITIELTLP